MASSCPVTDDFTRDHPHGKLAGLREDGARCPLRGETREQITRSRPGVERAARP
jgi:hypothetical protein